MGENQFLNRFRFDNNFIFHLLIDNVAVFPFSYLQFEFPERPEPPERPERNIS